MTHAVAIELHNWFRFKGEHRIDLQPGVYGVTAAADDNPERSNWIGKSTFLASMPFALHGWHPARTEDGWITRGETEGGVTFHLSDGATIRRTRAKRSATQLVYTAGGTTMQGAAAQQALVQHYGMSETDLFMTCFYRQKEMSALLTMDPAVRMSVVSDWLDLGPLQKAEQLSSELAKTAELELQRARDALTRINLEIERLEQADVATALPAAQQQHEQAAAEVQRLQKELAVHAERHALERDADEFGRINARGQQIRDRLAALGDVASRAELDGQRAALQHATQACGQLRQRWQQVKVQGDFDGKCPVAGIECPARQQINASTAEARDLKDRLAAELEAAQRSRDEDAELLHADQGLAIEVETLDREREQLRPRALALVGAPAKLLKLGGAQPDDVGARLDTAQDALAHATQQLTALQGEAAALTRLHAEALVAAEKLRTSELAAKLARTSGLVHRAAQRVVAEGTMARVERDANLVLADSGIDLSVAVTWAREGNSPAKSCDQCGAGYPVSAKVKQCGVCGATRGKHMVEKLEIGTSDTSGAAEDLAGIAIRLAASAWLRDRRQAGWSMAAIDEPFGALDQANKRALSTHLATMLASPRYGFAQAFVVAHDRGIMDALPNRIELVGTREGTRFG